MLTHEIKELNIPDSVARQLLKQVPIKLKKLSLGHSAILKNGMFFHAMIVRDSRRIFLWVKLNG